MWGISIWARTQVLQSSTLCCVHFLVPLFLCENNRILDYLLVILSISLLNDGAWYSCHPNTHEHWHVTSLFWCFFAPWSNLVCMVDIKKWLSVDIGSMNIMKLSFNIRFSFLLPSRHSLTLTPCSCTEQRLDWRTPHNSVFLMWTMGLNPRISTDLGSIRKLKLYSDL